MSLILHITGKDAWEVARALGRYEGDTLHTEGFIHCSTPAQVVRVANARFRARKDLVLLAIDERKVPARVVHENLEGGSEPFPHIYGALPTSAVVAVLPFAPRLDGTFALPELPPLS
ncbi:MAG: DUF952 domain-containing protein [Myxococcota bacterium]